MKFKVSKIEITRAEGPTKLCGRTQTFKDYATARAYLWSMSSTYPKMGYDKHDVVVEWEDGHVYKFRLDCKHHSCEFPNLDIGGHLTSFFQIYGGIFKPTWMTDKQWESFKRENEYCRQSCLDMLEKYEM